MKHNLTFRLTLSFAIMIMCVLQTIAQNTCSTATPIEYNNETLSLNGTTTGISNDNASSGAGSCITSVGVAGQKWYSFTWPGCSSYTVNLSTDNPGTNYDTKLHVYSGTCGSLVCVAGDDDGGVTIGNASILQFTAQPGTTYLIRVGGFNLLSGNYVLTLTAGFGGCNDATACNYQQSLDWNNCSCCYSGCGSITLPDNPSIGPNSYIRVNVDNYYSEQVHAGETISFCQELNCDSYLHIVDWENDGWGGAEVSITSNGQTFQRTIISDPFGQYMFLQVPGCGCTNVDACNFSAQATMDDGNCHYRTNGTCDQAQLIAAPVSLQTNTYCEPNESANLACLSSSAKDLWYKFVYPGGVVIFNGGMSGNGEEMILALREECNGAAIICDNNYNAQYTNILMASCADGLVKGNTYLLQFGTYNQPGMDLYLNFRVLPIPGCTNPDALNFNDCASVDDNSCLFTGSSCPGDINGDGIVNVTDVLFVVGAFGNICN